MAITVRVTNNRLGALSVTLKAGIREAVSSTVFAVEADAKQRSPVDTGALRSSISGRMTGDTEGVVEVGAAHGIFQEYGTRHQSAQPYLTPAAEAQRAPFEARIKKILN